MTADHSALHREQQILREASAAQLAQIDKLEMALDRVQDEHDDERRKIEQSLQSEITKLEKELEFVKDEREAEITGLRQELEGTESHWKEKCSKLEAEADELGRRTWEMEKDMKVVGGWRAGSWA